MTTSRDIVVIYSTVPAAESEKIARHLVDRRIVACVNVFPVRSYYRWEWEFCDEPEQLMIIKTAREKTQEVIAEIKKIHPYELPEIIVLPVIAGYPPYISWVRKETKESC
ncbi:MAG: divalent-cation tolerance protein CutA [Methanoregula sp.]|jgi:periplasmic divalent cation tolerance protein